MFNNLRKLRQQKQKITQKDLALFHKNSLGELVYEIKLGRGEIYSSFATPQNPIINESLIEHIDDVCDCLSSKDNVEFRILTPEDNVAIKENISEAIDNHYNKKLIQSKRQYQQQLKHGLILFLIGMAIFGIYWLLRLYVDPTAHVSVFEFVDIASWVFVWEAVDVVFLGMIAHKNEQKRYLKIVHAKITIITKTHHELNIKVEDDLPILPDSEKAKKTRTRTIKEINATKTIRTKRITKS